MKKLFLLFSLSACVLGTTRAQSIVGLTTDGRIFEMSQPSMPATITTPVNISGVASGQQIAGIDYRPNTGELYALGYDPSLTTGNAQLYTINKSTGAATVVGLPMTLDLGTGSIGFDFNPTVDRIRVVGENRKNYRLHPVTGAIAAIDMDLAYAATDVNTGIPAQVGACAYTNSYIGSEATTLYDYDQSLNILATQIPPNDGTLNTIGSSGITVNAADPSIGMDIYFDPVTRTNMAYLNANTGSGVNDDLYTVNLTTGAVTLIGQIGGGLAVKEIAVEIDRDVPATYGGQLVYGLTKNNRNLVTFSTDEPELIRELMPVTGVTAGQVIVGMDVRPEDLGLYALGYNATTREYQLYQINKATGAATAVNTAPGIIHLGAGEHISFDFNPTVDRIRVISTNDSNYRLHPGTGAIVATDTMLSYNTTDVNSGENPHVSTVAYINSYRGTATTTLFGIDDVLNVFANIVPPNQGILNTLTSNIVSFNMSDLSNDMDFFYDSTTADNMGFLAANTGSSMNDDLYMITPAGTATFIGNIGMGVQIADIAVQLTFTNSIAQNIAGVRNRDVFKVYPNPVTENLVISFLETVPQNTGLVITDVAGRVVKSRVVNSGTGKLMIDVSDLTNGIYFIKLPDAESRVVRFLKN